MYKLVWRIGRNRVYQNTHTQNANSLAAVGWSHPPGRARMPVH